MFTGIITAMGHIVSIQPQGDDVQVCIKTNELDMSDVGLGDSIAVSGVCLTVTQFGPDYFMADVSIETLSCTILQEWSSGVVVNLEKALQVSDRLGGHLVSGHVDGVGRLTERCTEGRSERLSFEVPNDLTRYIAAKGSICINGVSLTVNTVNNIYFSVNIVPHTLVKTSLNQLQVGQSVNLEVDLIARYLEKLLMAGEHSNMSSGVTLALLQQRGFIKD